MAEVSRNPLVLKLDCSGFLEDSDHTILSSLTTRTRQVDSHQDLILEGDRPENVLVIMEGMACRYKLMAEGKRQIMALLIPGDLCDLHVALLDEMDHGISTLSPCTVVDIPRSAVRDLLADHPRIALALLWTTLVDQATLREWLASMGQRAADKRMAHLFCELLVRLQIVGLASGDRFDLLMTQGELADLFGISAVHANRMVQDLRSRGLIVLTGKSLSIPNVKKLQNFCNFNPNYLHLIPRTGDSNET